MDDVNQRIRKDIVLFDKQVLSLMDASLSRQEEEVIQLAHMYSKDANFLLEKGDLYTSFASISYAHGLLDAILKLKGIESEGP